MVGVLAINGDPLCGPAGEDVPLVGPRGLAGKSSVRWHHKSMHHPMAHRVSAPRVRPAFGGGDPAMRAGGRGRRRAKQSHGNGGAALKGAAKGVAKGDARRRKRRRGAGEGQTGGLMGPADRDALEGGEVPPCVTFRRVAVSLRGPGQSPGRPFAC